MKSLLYVIACQVRKLFVQTAEFSEAGWRSNLCKQRNPIYLRGWSHHSWEGHFFIPHDRQLIASWAHLLTHEHLRNMDLKSKHKISNPPPRGETLSPVIFHAPISCKKCSGWHSRKTSQTEIHLCTKSTIARFSDSLASSRQPSLTGEKLKT